jgi:cellulose synthase/poly-beta-1,6-N-acetylglucosamine synthase-like glycosyltransferase
VLYRRSLLEKIGGFNERFLRAQDAEMAFRIKDSGFCLKFDAHSIVKHYHPTTFKTYFKSQREQGYWRAWLYFEHPGKAAGDSYSTVLDHVQPFLALLSMASAPFALFGYSALMWGTITALIVVQLPMTARLLRQRRGLCYLNYPWMASARAYVRAIGFCHGVGAVIHNALRRTS